VVTSNSFAQNFGRNEGESVTGPFLIVGLVIGYIIYLIGENSKKDCKKEAYKKEMEEIKKNEIDREIEKFEQEVTANDYLEKDGDY